MGSFLVGFLAGAVVGWVVAKYGFAGLWERIVAAKDWVKAKLPGQ